MLTVVLIVGESATEPVELIDDEDDIAVDTGAPLQPKSPRRPHSSAGNKDAGSRAAP
jgi:hypothetical protein